MAHTFCFTIDGERHCFDIPVLVERFPREPDPPDPFRLRFQDLRVLTTMAELAATVSAEASIVQELQGTIETAMQRLVRSMPEGTSVEAVDQQIAIGR